MVSRLLLSSGKETRVPFNFLWPPHSHTHKHTHTVTHILHATKKWWGGDRLRSNLQEDSTQQQPTVSDSQADLGGIMVQFCVSEYHTEHNYSDFIRMMTQGWHRLGNINERHDAACKSNAFWKGFLLKRAFNDSRHPEQDMEPKTYQGLRCINHSELSIHSVFSRAAVILRINNAIL